ncbi:MAG: hypothetical protein CL960_05495 [Euryarchaeota archaeon]|jgi:tRNA nucleotidyltransferase (CCA-adding enzyme)|nr:hypothetical protein [Euryarchaeota archaeon]
MQELLEGALATLVPSDAEQAAVATLCDSLLARARKAAPDGVEPRLVGSVAKGTWLPGADIDLFLCFPTGADLKVEGLALARAVLPDGAELYAQHPYLRGSVEGREVDAVPCFAISDPSQLASAVDRTVFHTAWVHKHLSDTQRDDVRLAKRFLAVAGAYGAAAAVGGFSGYLVEVLVHRAGDFPAFVEDVAGWRPPVALGTVPGAPEAEITLPDPVDPGRNVAAGVMRDGLARAVLAARRFLAVPTAEAFVLESGERKPLGCVTTVVLAHPGGVEETALPHIQRQGRKLVRALEPFGVLGSHCSLGDEGFIVLETATVELPERQLHRGPAAWDAGAFEFLERYPGAVLRDGRFWALKPPRHADIASAVQSLLPGARVVEGLADGAEPLPAA